MPKFCPLCNYKFVATSDLPIDESVKGGGDTENHKKQKTKNKKSSHQDAYDELFEKTASNKSIGKRAIEGLDYEKIVNHPQYQLSTPKSKSKINTIVKKIRTSNYGGGSNKKANWVCQNCHNYEEIPSGTIIYESSKAWMDFDRSQDEDVLDDNTYLRTRFMICPNMECENSQQPSVLDSIEMRQKRCAIMKSDNKGSKKYLCRNCGTSWQLQV